MGNSGQQWRASFAGCTRGCHSSNSKITSSPLWYHLLVLLVLLVIGGVELNPGPVQGGQVKYRKTSGAADMSGELYECKLAALLFLRCVNSEREFHIASNMAAAVSYDDVVLTLGQRSAFLQLKHKQQKNAKIYTSQLFTVKGDFSLIRCWKSFLDIKQRWAAEEDLQRCGQFNDCLFVMYTNASLVGSSDSNVGSNDMLDLANTGGKLIQFTEKQHPDIYQFFRDLPGYKQLLSDAVNAEQVVSSKELLEVVKKLHNKEAKSIPDKKVLEVLLKELDSLADLSCYAEFLSHLCFCTEQAAESALNGLIKSQVKVLFRSDEQSDKFTDGVQNWSRRNNYLLTVDAKFFQDIIKTTAANITKHVPVLNVKFSQHACQQITETCSCGNRKLLIISDCSNFSVVKVLQCFEDNTFLIDASAVQRCMNEVATVWKFGKCDVLVVKGWTRDVTTLADKLTSLPETKCLVVISDTCQAEHQFVAVSDSFCFSQLEPESQRQVLASQVDFQGYTVRLNSLADESFLQTELSADVVEQLHNTLHVGQKLQERDPCYLQRTFLRNDVVNECIFKDERISLAITGVDLAGLAELVPPGEQVLKFNCSNFMMNEDCRCWLVEGEADFTALCTVKDNIHWIEACERGFRWIQSNGDVSQVRNHFTQESSRNADSVVGLPHRMVLVVAEPGMGKSVEIANIGHVVKQKHPDTWVVRVNLNECATLFTRPVTAVEFLQQVASLKTEFEKRLLEHQLLSGGKVVVLVDGFDEISPNYSDQVFELLNKFSECKIKKIFVTSRLVMKKELEQKLSSIAFSFRGFDCNDQENFLFTFWNLKPQVTEFISLLLYLVRYNLNDRWNEFVGIPLQCRMLAEVFNDDANHFCRTGKVRLPSSLDVLLLYEQFVDKKLNIYFEKMYGNVSTGMLQMKIDDEKLKLQQSHMSCAMFSYFNDIYFDELNSLDSVKAENVKFIERFNRGKDKNGIVTHTVGDKAVFVHRTFAEYFVAMWISQNFQTELYLIKQIYFNKNFEVIQKFVDRMLTKGHELHIAVINTDLPKVQNLILEQSADVNKRDRGDRTALHLAIMNVHNQIYFDKLLHDGKYRIIETLLEHGADVNCVDKVLHCSPLQLAKDIEKWYSFGKLGNQADDIDQVGHSGMHVEYRPNALLEFVINEAQEKEHVNLVKFALNCGVSEQLNMGYTMLHKAARSGHLKLVQLFIERGTDVNASNVFKRTPLSEATEVGHVKVVELLVEHGASVNLRDADGRTALAIAADNGNYKLVDFLLPLTSCDVNDIDSVICAASCGDVEAAQILIQNKSINSQKKFGVTALFLAAGLGKHKMVEFLLQHGAYVDISDNSNRTPLMLAALNGHVKTAKLLLEHGASVNVIGEYGWNPLILAVGGHHELVELLLLHGADVNTSSERGWTPLMEAAEFGSVRIVELLVKHGACVNARYEGGNTALSLAAQRNHVDVIELLKQHGAVERDTTNTC